jgi:DGQHR domain-containing protein
MSIEKISLPCLSIKLGEIDAFVFMMKVKDLEYIHYVARRGQNNEEGAVQRVLSTIRLKSIENYVLNGNIFYTPFFLNWTNSEEQIAVLDGCINIPLVAGSAQILDGQHRVAGLQLASNRDATIGERNVLIILTNGLETVKAAEIFLNINTEQRPVQKSLIYDLFGLINQNDPDMPIVRANDIVSCLNETKNSPYYNLIKLPGTKRGIGCIDMSTVVSSLKDRVNKDGVFIKHKLESLEAQKNTILNFFLGLKYWYDQDSLWTNKSKNPFLTNAGFIAAIDILCNIIIPKCASMKSFQVETIYRILNLNDYLLTRESIKNQEGKTQRKIIYEYLESSINKELPGEDGYTF